MSGSVCPACGVAVVPGYVKCPKCHRPLPRTVRNSTSPVGGTTLDGAKRSSAILPIVLAVVIAGAIIAYFSTRSSKHAEDQRATPSIAVDRSVTTAPTTATPNPVAQPTTTAPTTQHPEAIAADLERSLKKQRLWSTVSIVGDHVDVRSGSCTDPAMKPSLDLVAGSFKATGLTKIRCVEQSGSLVFDRDL